MSLSNIKVNNEQIISIDDTPGNNDNLTKNQYFMMSSNQFNNLLPLYDDTTDHRQTLMFRGQKGILEMNSDEFYDMTIRDYMYTIYKSGEMNLIIDIGRTYIGGEFAVVAIYDINYNIVLKSPGVGDKTSVEHEYVSIDISNLSDGLYYVYCIATCSHEGPAPMTLNKSYNIIDSITSPSNTYSDSLIDSTGQMATFTGYGWDAAVYEYTIENNDGLYLLYYTNNKGAFDMAWSYFAYYDSSYNLIQTYNILESKDHEIIESYVPILSNVKYIRVCMNLTYNYMSSKIVRIDYSTQTIKDVVVRNSNTINDINDDINAINDDITEIRNTIDGIIIDPTINQWSGKTWYAYGTSITSVSQGTYVPYLAEMLNMNVVNKGIGGGGIGDLGGYSHGQVRNALMNTTDGKLNADLITLETTANDTGPNVPIGDIYDTDETTLCGCLNMCLRYLQKYTTAQIVVFTSVSITTEPSLEQSYYNTMLKYRDVCFINRVYWVDAGANLGWGKISNDRTYTKDNIHQTSLGGYILAKNLYYQIRNIPIFDKQLPS